MKKLLFVLLTITLLASCRKVSVEQTQVIPEPIKKTTLNVGTLYGAQIYVTTGQGEAGFDFEMASRFAKYLKLELKLNPYSTISELY